MGKNLIGKAMNAITRCPTCKGDGRLTHYIQAAEITKNGKVVGVTDCTRFKTCPTCGGSGRSH